MYKFVIPDVRIVAVVFVTDEQPMAPAVPIAVATPKRAKDGKAIGNSTVPVLSAPPGDQLWRSIYPPWLCFTYCKPPIRMKGGIADKGCCCETYCAKGQRADFVTK